MIRGYFGGYYGSYDPNAMEPCYYPENWDEEDEDESAFEDERNADLM